MAGSGYGVVHALATVVPALLPSYRETFQTEAVSPFRARAEYLHHFLPFGSVGPQTVPRKEGRYGEVGHFVRDRRGQTVQEMGDQNIGVEAQAMCRPPLVSAVPVLSCTGPGKIEGDLGQAQVGPVVTLDPRDTFANACLNPSALYGGHAGLPQMEQFSWCTGRNDSVL